MKDSAALERQEQHARIFEGIASTTPDFVYAFDRQGRFLYANRRLLEVWGMTLPEVIGKTCRELGYEQWHHDMHMREIAQVIATKSPIKGEVPFKAPLTGVFGIYEYIFTPVFGPDGEVETIAGTTRDVTERKRAEEALRASEARQAFLLEFSDALRPLADPVEIQAEAARVLGERLRAGRVGYAECLDDSGIVVIGRHYTNGVPSIEGRYRLEVYGSTLLADLLSGRPVLRDDIPNDPLLTAAEKAAFAALPVGAMADIPLVKNGRLVSILFVHHGHAHTFTATEIGLMEAVAERTWAAVEQARAESALRQSEQRFRAFVTATSDVLYRMNADWTEMRDLIRRGSGAEPEGPIGNWLETYIDPADRSCIVAAVKEAIHNRSTFEIEHRVLRRDGSVGWAFSRAVPLLNANGEIAEWFGSLTDITKRKRAEEALRESESRVSFVLEAAQFGAWDLNLVDHTAWRSAKNDEVFGYTEGLPQWTYEMFLEHVLPEDRADVDRKLRDAVASGADWQFECRIRRADGVVRWIWAQGRPHKNEHGEPVRMSGVTQDITERKEAEAALLASESRERARAAELQAILEAAPVALFIAKDAECRNMIGSRMTYEMLHVAPGANVSKSAPEDERPTTFRAVRDGREIPPEELPAQKAAATGRPVRNCEFDIVYEDGTCRNMLGDAVPLFDEHGRTRGSVGAFVDITERKRHEERLRQAQKLESVGLLAGGIAHDFNNLLTGILGNASMVLDELPPGPAARIREVIAAAERAAHLTRQLLAYSGKGQFVVRDIDVSEAVHEISSLVEFSIPKSAQLSVTVQHRLPAVRMDPSQLQQILMNLVINAGEAIGEGKPGRITVGTSLVQVEEPRPDALGEEILPGRYVCIDVTDTGHGIDPATQPKIFDPFFTTKFTGRGLGLAAVAGILRAQRGAITLDTAPGRGSTFRVFLPVGDKQPAPSEAASGKGLGTVLVVDDDVTVREFISAVFRRRGYHVLVAADGREALSVCRREGGPVNGVILDVVMPVMGARELIPKLRSEQPEMRVLLTSGYSEAEARRLCAEYPGAAFIQKPYTAKQILAAVEDMLGTAPEKGE